MEKQLQEVSDKLVAYEINMIGEVEAVRTDLKEITNEFAGLINKYNLPPECAKLCYKIAVMESNLGKWGEKMKNAKIEKSNLFNQAKKQVTLHRHLERMVKQGKAEHSNFRGYDAFKVNTD